MKIHLIDKSALLAKIEGLIEKYNKCSTRNNYEEGLKIGRLIGYKDALYKINTLEAKDVDLEKEINTYITNNFFGSETLGFFANRTKEEPNDQDIALCAKYFFELGLHSTITEEDCKLIWNIGDEIPYMPEEEFFKELLKRYKAQKGEKV